LVQARIALAFIAYAGRLLELPKDAVVRRMKISQFYTFLLSFKGVNVIFKEL
jgi:hypothetical protein